MIIKKQEQIKTTHHIVECNGYTIHRREKLEYDFKEEVWIRKSMTWNCDHRGCGYARSQQKQLKKYHRHHR